MAAMQQLLRATVEQTGELGGVSLGRRRWSSRCRVGQIPEEPAALDPPRRSRFFLSFNSHNLAGQCLADSDKPACLANKQGYVQTSLLCFYTYTDRHRAVRLLEDCEPGRRDLRTMHSWQQGLCHASAPVGVTVVIPALATC